MKKLLLAGVSLAAMGLINGANAADTYPPLIRGTNVCDPYKDYSCLDAYLGTDFLSRFINYYRLEWGHDVAPADPKAPPGVWRRPRMVARSSLLVSIKSSVSAPKIPCRPAYTLAIRLGYLRAVSSTPQADALMTAVTPPDWA